jgi:hypothetical protein
MTWLRYATVRAERALGALDDESLILQLAEDKVEVAEVLRPR